MEGDDEDGVPDGLGCMQWRDGSNFAGEFRQGQLDGLGEESYADGSYYRGEFRRDMRDGLGEFCNAAGEQQWDGVWQNGETYEPTAADKGAAEESRAGEGSLSSNVTEDAFEVAGSVSHAT